MTWNVFLSIDLQARSRIVGIDRTAVYCLHCLFYSSSVELCWSAKGWSTVLLCHFQRYGFTAECESAFSANYSSCYYRIWCGEQQKYQQRWCRLRRYRTDIYDDQISNASHGDNSESDEEAPTPLRMRDNQGICSASVPSSNAQRIPKKDLMDKNGAVWRYNPPAQIRRATENIVRQRGGPTQHTRAKSPEEIWNLFFTDDILLKIVENSRNEVE